MQRDPSVSSAICPRAQSALSVSNIAHGAARLHESWSRPPASPPHHHTAFAATSFSFSPCAVSGPHISSSPTTGAAICADSISATPA
eukprot:3453246-Rhodomonas_salina.1